MDTFLQETLFWLAHSGAAILCLVGIFISLFSFTGSWLVVIASGILFISRDDGAVSGWLVFWLIAGAALVELFDFLAGNIGIARRGGSAKAGWAALFGGIVGMMLGAFIPIPIAGSILGMCLGSFAFAFIVERNRLQHGASAAHIAWGAVWARLGVMFVKITAALGMTGALWYVVLVK